MATLLRDRPAAATRPARGPAAGRRVSRRTWLLLAAAVLWLLGFLLLRGTGTLALPASELTAVDGRTLPDWAFTLRRPTRPATSSCQRTASVPR